MGFGVALSPVNLLFCFIGVLFGTIIGALPGIGPSAGVAILLPLTFGQNPITAIIMLAGIYYGAMYGGTITSVLINVPGEASSVMTTIDGYQMARKGRAGVALGIAAFGSFIAGTISLVIFMFLAPSLANWALSFGPPEYVALMLLGFAALAGLSDGSPTKTLVSTLVGLFLAIVGIDIVSGSARFTFGTRQLLGGFDFLPIAMGLFGITEVLSNAEKMEPLEIEKADLSLRNVFPKAKDWMDTRWAILRSTFLGFVVGVLPGAGATIASFLSYASEKKISKHPETFGHGEIVGVAAPESANNAASVGAMVPLLTLGVPGSATTAVMMGALMMWGLRPGPLLFEKNPQFVWGLIASMYIGNVMLVLMNVFFIPAFIQILRIPQWILSSMIVLFCVVGVYSLGNNLNDVWIMLIFGIVGFVMRKLGYPHAPLVLAVVLGAQLEMTLRQSLMISHGSMAVFFTRPISRVLMVVAMAMLAMPLLRGMVGRYRKSANVAR